MANSAFQLAVKNTVVFTGVAVPLAVVLSLVLALMLECRIPLKSQFRTFFLSPMVVPIASIILVWQVLFHSNGVVNEFLATFGVDKIDWLKSDFCKVVIVVLFEWKNLGYFMILFMARRSTTFPDPFWSWPTWRAPRRCTSSSRSSSAISRPRYSS